MKIWMIIIFVSVSLSVYSQELVMPELPETDSLEMNLERELLYRQLLSGSFMATDLMLPLQVPRLDFNATLAERWTFDSSEISFNTFQWDGHTPGFMGLVPSPFFYNGSVFSSAVYQLNDRFTVGGYSFGAKSAFSAPLPGLGVNSYDIRGSTMFLKYNVSKNFKIETRVNVIQSPGPGF